MAGIIFGKDVELPYKHNEIAIDKSTLKKFVGNYENIEIIIDEGRLYLNKTDNELVPETTQKFFSKNNNDRTIEFRTNKRGKVELLILTKGGVREIKNKTK